MKNQPLFIPAIAVIVFVVLTFICDLLRQPSDTAVYVAIGLLILLYVGIYFLIKYLNKLKKQENEENNSNQ